jgi:hypothetical protein
VCARLTLAACAAGGRQAPAARHDEQHRPAACRSTAAQRGDAGTARAAHALGWCCSSRAHTRHVAHARANGTHSAAHGAAAPRRDVGSNQLATHVVGSNQRPHGRVSAGCTRLPHLTAAEAAGLLPLLSLAAALPPLAPAARSRATAIVVRVDLRSKHAAAHHRTTARLFHRAHAHTSVRSVGSDAQLCLLCTTHVRARCSLTSGCCRDLHGRRDGLTICSTHTRSTQRACSEKQRLAWQHWCLHWRGSIDWAP